MVTRGLAVAIRPLVVAEDVDERVFERLKIAQPILERLRRDGWLEFTVAGAISLRNNLTIEEPYLTLDDVKRIAAAAEAEAAGRLTASPVPRSSHQSSFGCVVRNSRPLSMRSSVTGWLIESCQSVL